MTIFIPAAEKEEIIKITGEDAKHLFVLRPQPEDEYSFSDGENYTYKGIVTKIDRKGLTVLITEKNLISKNKICINLFAGLLKGDKNELIIQKATELGAEKITFFTSENCVVKPGDNTPSKLERFKKIAKNAAMQCGSEKITQIGEIIKYNEMVKDLSSQNGILFYENSDYKLSSFLKEEKLPEKTAFATGPEGGFSPAEIKLAAEKKVPLLSLGQRILRAETAPICAISILLSHFGEI